MAGFTTTRVRMKIDTTEEVQGVLFGETLAFVAGVLETVPAAGVRWRKGLCGFR